MHDLQDTDKTSNDGILISSERILTRLLEQIWTVMLFVIVIAGTTSVLRAQVTGWLPIYSLHVALAVLFCISYALRKQLSFNMRVLIVMTVFYVAGIAALFSFGTVGAGVWWLILCALIAKVFYPVRTGIAHAVACLLLMLVAAYCYITGLLTLPFEIGEYLRSPATWASLIIGCALLSFFIFAAVAAYQRATLALLKQVGENKRLLEQHMNEIHTLRSFIPICAQCKQVRDDKGYWASVEDYLHKHADMSFSHCMCPDCGRKLYGEAWDRANQPAGDTSRSQSPVGTG
jgi:hypothetical protein